MDEREVKLAAPPGFKLPDIEGGGSGLVAGPVEVRHLNTVYFDTPDLRLARWGCSLRHRGGEGWTVKLPASFDGPLLVRPEHTFPGTRGRPHPEALDLVRAYLRTEAPEPVAHLRTVRRVVPLLDEEGRRVAELSDDEVSVLDGRRVAARFRELELEVQADLPDGALAAIIERLRAAGAGAPDPTPKLVRALGPGATAPPELTSQAQAGDASTAEAIRFALAESVTRLLRHDAGVRLGQDAEAVHQARVATRRLRSDLRTFRSLLDPDWNSELRAELKWLGGLLGAVRDADVLLDRLRSRAAGLPEGSLAEPLLGRLDRRRDVARKELLQGLRSQRYAALLDRAVAAALNPPLDPQAATPAVQVLPGLLAGPWGHLEKAVADLSDPPTDEELHQVRIRTKRVRYAAEAAAPALGKKTGSLARAATRLQDALGEHQDAVVAREWLAEASRTATPRQAFVAGELSVLELQAAREARTLWAPAWKALAKRRSKAGL